MRVNGQKFKYISVRIHFSSSSIDLKLAEDIYSELGIVAMSVEISLWGQSHSVRGLDHFPWLPHIYTEYCSNVLTRGPADGPFQPVVITLCSQSVCPRSKYFKCSTKQCLCGADLSMSPVHLHLNVIDNLQSSKSLRWAFLKCCFEGILRNNHFNMNRTCLHWWSLFH